MLHDAFAAAPAQDRELTVMGRRGNISGMLKRAYRQGLMAAQEGLTREVCPYVSPYLASAWVSGWKVGRAQEVARMKRHLNNSEMDFNDEHYDAD